MAVRTVANGVLWDEKTNDVWVDTNQNLSFTDEKALTNYGVLRFRAGDYAEAARWYGVAEAASDGALEYRCKRQLAESRSRRATLACRA